MRWALMTVFVCTAILAYAQDTVRGPVTIYDTVYEQVDPGTPFTEAPRQEENWQPATPLPAERQAGFIPYTRPEPFDIKPWSRPKAEERVQTWRVFAAQGEIASAWFALYALEPLKGVRINVKGAPHIRVTPLYAHYWAQRTDWRGRTYYITPELLLEMREGRAQFPAKGGTLEWRDLNVPQAETRLFWLQIRVSPQARAGEYVVPVQVQAGGKAAITLPLRMYVYPFRLQKPQDKRWLLYSDSWRLSHLPDDKLLALMREIAAYGIDGFTELPFGTLDLSELKEGKVGYDPAPLLRWHRLMEQAGLRGPHTIGTFIEDQVPAQLGIKADVNREWTPPVRNAMRLIARTVIDTLKPHRINWMFYGWDEPAPESVRAIEQYRNWREAGANTYVTFFQQETYTVAAQWMTHPCFSVGLVASSQLAQWAREQCRKRGQQFYWYGSGCYLGQEGRMFPNRFLAGWLFWKTKADGQVSWTFVRPFEDPFNDFDGVNANPVEPKDQCTVYPHYASPNDVRTLQGVIRTIHWEALREGITDYRYLHTLRNTIAYARQIATGRSGRWARGLWQLAQECENTLHAIEESVPWLGEVGQAGFDNGDLQETRLVVGQCIERLVRYLRGDTPSAPQRTRTIQLQIRFIPPTANPISTRFLPVLTVPRWSQPPVIDGRLEESQWRRAAVAAPFYQSENSVPIPDNLHTQALLGVDENALYIGFHCRAPSPDLLVAEQTKRDAYGIWLDEGVEIFLASPNEPRKYAHFIINLNGAVYDELGFDVSWNTEIQSATHRDDTGWYLEVAIPWKSLPFGVVLQQGKPFLRLNLGRNHKQRGNPGTSHWAWSPTFGWFHNSERFGAALLQQGDILVKAMTAPTYVDDSPLRVSLLNTGQRPQQVRVDSRTIRIVAGQEVEVTFPSRLQPGEHVTEVNIQWLNGSANIVVPYAIIRPLHLTRQATVAIGEVARIHVPVSWAFRRPNSQRLLLHLPDRTVRIPFTNREQTIRLDNVRGQQLLLRFAVEGQPQWSDQFRLYLAPP